MDVSIIGGTGKQGFGIALRLAEARHHVIIGSRAEEHAREVAARVRERVGTGARVDGAMNDQAAGAADVVFVTVPPDAQTDVYRAIAPHLRPYAIVVDTTNLLAPLVKERPGEIGVPQDTSAAEEAAKLLPEGVTLVAGFQTVSAARLQDLGRPPEGDVLLCGDDSEAKATVGSLVEDMPGLRWVDAGGLSMARAVERLTALLISVNKRYGIKSASVHLLGHETFGLPPEE